jgi:hypothetical protein
MISATTEPSARSYSLFRRLCKWLIISVGMIVAALAIYQFSMTEWDSHRYPAPGKLVDIGGLQLHINCTGAGSPTVILEAGPNDSSLIWQLAQPQISRFTRVCSYDRPGFGWSDAAMQSLAPYRVYSLAGKSYDTGRSTACGFADKEMNAAQCSGRFSHSSPSQAKLLPGRGDRGNAKRYSGVICPTCDHSSTAYRRVGPSWGKRRSRSHLLLALPRRARIAAGNTGQMLPAPDGPALRADSGT